MRNDTIHNPGLLARLMLALTLVLALAPTYAQAPADQEQMVRPENPAAEPDRWLTDERWGELRYGLTVRQPKNALLLEQTREGAMARWVLPNGANIGLSIHRGVHYVTDGRGNTRQQRIHLNTVVADVVARLEAGGVGGQDPINIHSVGSGRVAVTLNKDAIGQVHNTRSDQWVKVGDLLGWHNYFIVKPAGNAGAWFFGIAVLQLDDSSVLTLRMECPGDAVIESVSTFESMLHSVQVEPASKAVERIKGWVDAGDDLIDSVTQEQYRAAMHDDRLYMIREDDRVIGYQRVWLRSQDKAYYDRVLARLQQQDPQAKLEGIDAFKAEGNKLVIQSHYEAGDVVIDTRQEYLDEDDSIASYWEIKSTLSEANNPRSDITGSWVETGLRGKANFQNKLVDQIQVIREGSPPRQMTDFVLARERDPKRRLRFPSARADMVPSGETSSHAWATPPKAYLSAVDAWVTPALLPADQPRTYAFFAYHAESSAVALRIMRVEPVAGGGKLVYLRPTIDMAEQTLEYDANNELIRWTFHDGRVMEKTTREELHRVWRTR